MYAKSANVRLRWNLQMLVAAASNFEAAWNIYSVAIEP